MRTLQRARPARVMLVEDNPGVRRALTGLLNAAGDLRVCGEAGSVSAAGALAEATSPDVVIVDLRLADGSGVEVGRQVRAVQPEVRLLLLTSAGEDEALVAALLAGASGFLVKQLLGQDLVATVRAVAAGETLIDHARGAELIEQLRRRSVPSGSSDDVILSQVAQGRSDRQIGLDLGIDELAVRRRLAVLAAGAGGPRRRREMERAVAPAATGQVPGGGPGVPTT